MSRRAPQAGHSESFVSRMLWLVSLGVMVALLLAYASPVASPAHLWPVSFLALGYPSAVLLLVLLAGNWLLRGRWLRTAACIAVIALGYNALFQVIGSGAEPRDESLDTITFGTFNVLGGKGLMANDTSELATKAARLAQCVDVDVLALEESPRYEVATEALAAALAARGLTHTYYPDGGRVTLYSKYPLANTRLIAAYNATNAAVSADVLVNDSVRIHVVAAHLESNGIRLDAKDMVRDAANADPQAYRTVKGIAANYRRGARVRAEQAAELARLVEDAEHPVVLLGDLNDVPLSYALGTLRRAGLLDAFREAGTGLGITYAGSIPGLRIDYVLASPELRPVHAEVLNCEMSDHEPTTATFVVP